MTKKRRDLTPEENALWRRVGESVTPRRRAIPKAEPEAPKTRVIQGGARVHAPPAAKAKTARTYAPPPSNLANEKRVRRGKLEIGATLDLHGHTQTTARTALVRFLLAAQRRGERAVIVVTGVGRAGEGVLKRRLPEWLAEPEVACMASGYAPAHRTHGGAGAFYVFVRRAPHE